MYQHLVLVALVCVALQFPKPSTAMTCTWGYTNNVNGYPSLSVTRGTTNHVLCTSYQGYLTFQTDGNLVIYDNNNNAKWATGTIGGNLGQTVQFTNSGNLVVLNAAGSTVFSTNTASHCTQCRLVFQDDRNLVIYNLQSGGNLPAVWNSNLQVAPSHCDCNWSVWNGGCYISSPVTPSNGECCACYTPSALTCAGKPLMGTSCSNGCTTQACCQKTSIQDSVNYQNCKGY